MVAGDVFSACLPEANKPIISKGWGNATALEGRDAGQEVWKTLKNLRFTSFEKKELVFVWDLNKAWSQVCLRGCWQQQLEQPQTQPRICHVQLLTQLGLETVALWDWHTFTVNKHILTWNNLGKCQQPTRYFSCYFLSSFCHSALPCPPGSAQGVLPVHSNGTLSLLLWGQYWVPQTLYKF